MITSLARRYIQREIENFVRSDRVSLWIPIYTECTTCGFDPISRSGKDISCPECGGHGRTVLWASTYLSCRVMWTDVGRPRYDGVVTTGELGDATIETKLVHKSLLEDVRDSEGAYIEIDGKRLRIMSVDANRVEGKTTVVARCEIVKNV